MQGGGFGSLTPDVKMPFGNMQPQPAFDPGTAGGIRPLGPGMDPGTAMTMDMPAWVNDGMVASRPWNPPISNHLGPRPDDLSREYNPPSGSKRRGAPRPGEGPQGPLGPSNAGGRFDPEPGWQNRGGFRPRYTREEGARRTRERHASNRAKKRSMGAKFSGDDYRAHQQRSRPSAKPKKGLPLGGAPQDRRRA